MDDILIDATLLRNNKTQQRCIEEYVTGIICDINIQIRQAQQNGEYCIITEMPVIFDIPNMKNKNSQRIVWSKVIELLQSKKYDVKINATIDICRLKVSWVDKEHFANMERENNILASCSERF